MRKSEATLRKEDSMRKTSLKILVVDDASDWRATLKGILKDANHQVICADSVDTALHELHRYPFDVAIIDLRLVDEDPDNRDGIRLSRDIQTARPETKTIIVTGHSSSESIKLAREPLVLGERRASDAFIRKNDISGLVERVEALASKGQQ